MSSHPNKRPVFSTLYLAIASILLITGVLLAKPRSRVRVELDSDTRAGIPLHLRLRFTLNGQNLKMPLKVDPILGGAGLVIEHIASDGTITRQKKPPRKWWFRDGADSLLYIDLKSTIHSREVYPLNFDIWVGFAPLCKTLGPNGFYDFTKPGVYQISYEHPWASPEEDPNGILYSSNKLTVIPYNEKRSKQFRNILHNNPELEMVSYQFRNPPPKEPPGYNEYLYNPKLQEAIQNIQQDFVLYLLGSPDYIWIPKKKDGFDQEWHYTTSPVGGYNICFNDGKVVNTFFHADQSGH